MKKYKEWIAENCNDKDKVYRKCKQFTDLMQSVFPELVKCKGHYVESTGIQHAHHWLKDSLDNIIDPTRIQFNEQGYYEEFIGKEPIGKCVNCGEYTYEDKYFCSNQCIIENEIFMNKRQMIDV